MRSLQHHSKATTSRPRRPPCRARRSKSAAATGYGASCSRAITSRTTSAGCAPRGNHTPEHAICLGTARGDAAARDASRPRVERGGPETPRRGKRAVPQTCLLETHWFGDGLRRRRGAGRVASARRTRRAGDAAARKIHVDAVWWAQLWWTQLFKAFTMADAALQGTHRFVSRERGSSRHAPLRTARER